MLIAFLALSGVPPLSGFWSKDAIIAATVLTGQLPLLLLAWATVGLTFLYSLKALGLVFFGPSSGHIKKLQEEGHEVHEAPRLMWIPYLIMAIATVAIGLAGPYVETFFSQVLATTTTPVAQVTAPLSSMSEQQASLIASAGSLIMLLIGGSIGYMMYISRRLNPRSIVGETGFARSVYNFLWNRWYINPVYYRVFAYGTISAAYAIRQWVEFGFFDKISGTVARLSVDVSKEGQSIDLGVIDGAINGVASIGRRFSSAVRRLQTGVPEEYVMVFTLGLFALVVAVLFFLI
jgi:NADH-quinone oxidoreductase subunit L